MSPRKFFGHQVDTICLRGHLLRLRLTAVARTPFLDYPYNIIDVAAVQIVDVITSTRTCHPYNLDRSHRVDLLGTVTSLPD